MRFIEEQADRLKRSDKAEERARGEELGRIDIPFQDRGRDAEGRVRNLVGVKAVLIIGTNLEGIDLAHPFDPDVAPFEPHGATIYLARM